MIYIIYHNADLDGKGSAAILKHRLEESGKEPILVGANYNGKPLTYKNWGGPDIVIKPVQGDTVYMVDYTCEPTYLKEWKDVGVKLVGIDHHKTQENTFKEFDLEGVLDIGRCGAIELVWEYCYPEKETPKAIKYLATYDTFNKDRFDWDGVVLPFQFGMRSLNTWPNGRGYRDVWVRLIRNDRNFAANIWREGKIIVKYQQELNVRAMSRAFTQKFSGLNFLVCNGVSGSLAFETKYNPQQHDAVMTFTYDGKNRDWTVTMYGMGDKLDIDLSIIAKKYGGGGHAQACGFRTTELATILKKEETYE